MAREIHIPYGVVGSADVYLRFRNASGQYRRGDTGAYEAWNAGNIALYGADTGSGTPYHVASEDGSTGDYFADLPDATARGWSAYLQAGAAPSADGGVDVEIAADRIGIDATAAAQVNAAADQAATDYGANKIAPDPAGTGAAIVSALEGIPLTAGETETAAQAGAAAAIAAAGLTALLIAQREIDQTTTPWQLVLKDRTTGAELYRFDLTDENGDAVAAIDTFVAAMTTPP